MRKIILIFLLCLILGLPILVLAAAANCEQYCANPSLGSPSNQTCFCNPLKHKTFEELIKAIIVFLRDLALVATALVVVVSGFYFLSSAGDPAKVAKARQMITYAVAGLAIILAAEGIIALIEKVVKGT